MITYENECININFSQIELLLLKEMNQYFLNKINPNANGVMDDFAYSLSLRAGNVACCPLISQNKCYSEVIFTSKEVILDF